MVNNDLTEFNKWKKELLEKWHDRENYSKIQGYRDRDEVSVRAKRIREEYLPHALYLNKLYCPKCRKLFDDIDDFQYILGYCDDCRCDLEISDQELTN